MTVRLRITLACVVFTLISCGLGASAWRGQTRLSGLAIDLYDQAFVTEDFLSRATVAFDQFVAKRGTGAITKAEQAGPISGMLSNLDIAASRAQAPKTRDLLRRLHADIGALPALPAGRIGPAETDIADGLARAARRLSNDGLRQRDGAESSAAASGRVLMASVAGALAIAIATGLLLTRSVVPPLRQAAADMSRLCAGDVETIVRGTERRDEIGQLCRSLGVFKQTLMDNRELAADTTKQAEARRQRQAALIGLSQDFSTHAADQLGAVNGAVAVLQESAGVLADRAARIVSRSASVSGLADNAAESAGTVSEVVREITASGRDIAGMISESADATRQMMSEAEQARGLVDELGEVAAGVGSVVALISGIAGQTNLLALTPPSRPPAQARRGFGVVADEVKALARQTAQATEDVGGRIAALRSSASRTMTLIRDMANRIDAVERSGSAIAESVQRQGAAIERINVSLLAAARGIGEVAGSMRQLSVDAAENAGASAQVTTAAGHVGNRSGMLAGEIEYFVTATHSASDWRSFVRHDDTSPVTLTRTGSPPVEGRLRNISRGGTAVSAVCNWTPGSSCIVEGLIAGPLPARILSNSDGLVRLQFSQSEAEQAQLAEFMAKRFGERPQAA
jgi:methyl-accepting chemotaxis protein